MKTIRNLCVLLALVTVSAWAADRITVYRVTLAGPMGSDSGHLVASGDQLIFVDDTNANGSFVIPRSDIRSLQIDNGLLTIGMSRPFRDLYGSTSNIVVHVTDPNTPNLIASWVGMPLTAIGEASRVVPGGTTTFTSATIFDARYHGDRGKLIVNDTGLNWQDLSDASRSRSWSYAQIKELKRDKDENAIKIEPYNGEEHKFKIAGPFMTDTVYNMVADRVVAARIH